ncbi:MAG: InlB B-repeat-containing protein [Lachnospiraceae bacterium]|nr:InlB B-repeat-containing protein [Lachnospiraceae bacterium]
MRAFRKKTVIALSVLALLFPYSVSADEIADQSAHAQSVTVSAVSSGTEAGHYCVETRKTDERIPDFEADITESTIEYVIADEGERESVLSGNSFYVRFAFGISDYAGLKEGLDGASLKTVRDVENQYSPEGVILPFNISAEKYLAYDSEGRNPVEGSRRDILELSTPVRFCFDAPDIDETRQNYRNYHLVRICGDKAELIDSLTLGYAQAAGKWRFSFDADRFSAYILYYEIGAVTYNYYIERNDLEGGNAIPAAGMMIPGERVQITAEPNDGYEFIGWTLSGDCGDVELLDERNNSDRKANPASFLAPAHDVHMRADFKAIEYAVSTGIEHGLGSIQAYNASGLAVSKATVKDTITVRAVPETGYQIKSWAVTACEPGRSISWISDGDNNSISFPMEACEADIRVSFEKIPSPSYSLTLQAEPEAGGRAILKEGYSSRLEEGACVIVIAEPEQGYEFARWAVSGAGASVDNPSAERAVLTMGREDALVRAVFKRTEAIRHRVYLSEAENGFISGPSSGKEGDEVTITAYPDPGYQFQEWSVEGADINGHGTQNPLTLVMPGASISVSAAFRPVKINTAVSPIGAGTVRMSALGNVVSLSAVPIDGYRFERWSLNDGSDIVLKDVENSSVTFLLGHKDATLTAVFRREEYHRITMNCEGGGSVTASPSSARKGETVTLKALPQAGYELKEYRLISGDVVLAEPYMDSYSFLMGQEDLIITAVFAPRKYQVKLSSDGHGTAYANADTITGSSEDGSVSVPYGSAVSLIASPDSGYAFKKWTLSGTAVKQAASVRTTFMMPANDVAVKAIFEANKVPSDHYTITIQSDGHGTANAAQTSAKAGDIVSITASPDGGYSFQKWETISGSVYFLDNTKASTKIIMPSSDATIRAVFTQNSGSGKNPGSAGNSEKTDNPLYSSIFRDWNGVVIKTTVQSLGAPIQEPSPLSDFQMDGKNYSFVCWWSDENKIFDGICHGNHTFTALYYVTGAASQDNKEDNKPSAGTGGKTAVKTTMVTNQNHEAVKAVEESPEITREYLVLNKEDYTEQELDNLEEHSVKEEELTAEERQKMEDIIENNRVVRPEAPAAVKPEKYKIPKWLIIVIVVAILSILIGLLVWLFIIRRRKKQEYVEYVDLDEEIVQDPSASPEEGSIAAGDVKEPRKEADENSEEAKERTEAGGDKLDKQQDEPDDGGSETVQKT